MEVFDVCLHMIGHFRVQVDPNDNEKSVGLRVWRLGLTPECVNSFRSGLRLRPVVNAAVLDTKIRCLSTGVHDRPLAKNSSHTPWTRHSDTG